MKSNILPAKTKQLWADERDAAKRANISEYENLGGKAIRKDAKTERTKVSSQIIVQLIVR